MFCRLINQHKKLIEYISCHCRSAYFDIAVVEVVKKIQFSENIYPICIPDKPMELQGIGADVSGYGNLRDSTLTTAAINVRSNNYCTQKYNNISPDDEDYVAIQQVGAFFGVWFLTEVTVKCRRAPVLKLSQSP